jgi:hypothetical protein
MNLVRRTGDNVNLVVFDDIQPIVWGTTIPFFVICLTSCGIRLYTRAFIQKPFGIDDWFMAAGSVSVPTRLVVLLVADSRIDTLDRPAIHCLDVDDSRRWTVRTVPVLIRPISNCPQTCYRPPCQTRRPQENQHCTLPLSQIRSPSILTTKIVPLRRRILLPPPTILHQDVLPLLLPAHPPNHAALQNRSHQHHGLSVPTNRRNLDLLRPTMHTHPSILPSRTLPKRRMHKLRLVILRPLRCRKSFTTHLSHH